MTVYVTSLINFLFVLVINNIIKGSRIIWKIIFQLILRSHKLNICRFTSFRYLNPCIKISSVKKVIRLRKKLPNFEKRSNDVIKRGRTLEARRQFSLPDNGQIFRYICTIRNEFPQ